MTFPTLDNVHNTIRRKDLPQWILDTANKLYPSKAQRFLETNCDATAHAVCKAIDSGDWQAVDKPTGPVYRVVFDECEHTFVVVGDKVYQSYWNKHRCQITDYDPKLPYWAHVSVDCELYKDCEVTFFEP
jgi:hypothetical protein